MKKILYISLIAGAAALIGCAKDNFTAPSGTVTLSATTTDMTEAPDEVSRGGIVDGLGMHWHEGDKISLFRRGGTGHHAIDNNIEFTVSGGTFPSKAANFTGELREVDPDAIDSQQPSHYVALYPYSPDATHPGLEQLIADSYIDTTLPAVQYYTNDLGEAGVRGIPMLARGPISDEGLTFHPMYAMLRMKVKLKPEYTEPITIKNIVVSVSQTAAVEFLSGKARINNVGSQTGVSPSAMGIHSITWDAASASKSLTLDCGEGVVVNNTDETIFYIGVPKPAGSGGGLYGGYEFRFETEDGAISARTTTARRVYENGVLYRLPELLIDAPQAAEEVAIPDDALRAFLASNGHIEDLNDGKGGVVIVNTELQTLDLSSRASAIMSLEGLEAFPVLKTLTINGTGIQNLDITHMANLETFNCRTSPSMRSLDVSGLTKLKTISIYNNSNLESLDISRCPALTTVQCAAAAGVTYILNGSAITFLSGFSRAYMPALKTLKAEGLPQITRVSSANSFPIAEEDITITNISFKDCSNLNTMTLASDGQSTAITMDITNTPLASNPGNITGDNGKVTFIK